MIFSFFLFFPYRYKEGLAERIELPSGDRWNKNPLHIRSVLTCVIRDSYCDDTRFDRIEIHERHEGSLDTLFPREFQSPGHASFIGWIPAEFHSTDRPYFSSYSILRYRHSFRQLSNSRSNNPVGKAFV